MKRWSGPWPAPRSSRSSESIHSMSSLPPLPLAANGRQGGAIDGADHPHLRMKREPRQPVAAGCAGMNRRGEEPGPAGGVFERDVEELAPDAPTLVLGHHAVGGQVPDAAAILGDRKADHLPPGGRDPAAAGVGLEVKAHPPAPGLRSRRRPRLDFGLADLAVAPVGVHERRIRCAFGADEVGVLHRADLDQLAAAQSCSPIGGPSRVTGGISPSAHSGGCTPSLRAARRANSRSKPAGVQTIR